MDSLLLEDLQLCCTLLNFNNWCCCTTRDIFTDLAGGSIAFMPWYWLARCWTIHIHMHLRYNHFKHIHVHICACHGVWLVWCFIGGVWSISRIYDRMVWGTTNVFTLWWNCVLRAGWGRSLGAVATRVLQRITTAFLVLQAQSTGQYHGQVTGGRGHLLSMLPHRDKRKPFHFTLSVHLNLMNLYKMTKKPLACASHWQ